MKKIVSIVLLIVLACALFTGCGSQAKKEDGLKIGVCLYTMNDEWLAEVSRQFEQQCAEKGYSVSIQDGNMENETQMKQIENFIAQKYDAIILSAYDVEGILPAIDKCREANIPVVAVDTAIDHEWVSSVIAWDNYASGKMLGEYALEYINSELAGNDSVNLLMLDGTGYPHIEKRDQGFLEALSSVDNLNIVARQCTNANRELSANAVNNNIEKGIDIVYGAVDNHAWGAVTALKEANAEKCCVLSCGGYGAEPFEALAANDKYYQALVVVPPANIVTDALATVEKVLAGEKVEPVVNIEIAVASAANIADFTG